MGVAIGPAEEAPADPQAPLAASDSEPPTVPQLPPRPPAPRRPRRRGLDADLAWRAFAVLTIAPTLLLAAWLAAGSALLLAGRFLPAPMLLISLPVAAGLAMAVAGRPVVGRRTRAPSGRSTGRTLVRPWAVWLGTAGTLAVSVGFGVWQGLLASPQVFVERSPGAATQLGYWIAENGFLPVPVSASAFGGAHPGLAFASFGFAGHGAVLAPQVASGFPVLLSAGMWAHGMSGAALVAPVVGAMAVLAVGGLTGRLAGPQWAPVGAFLLALTLPEMYSSRSAVSEILTQALLFGGLCLVVDSLGDRPSRLPAAVGGVALGLTALSGLACLTALLPAIPFLGVMVAARRPQALALGGGLLAGAGYGITVEAVLSGPAVFAALRPAAPALTAFAGLTALGVAMALSRPAPQAAGRWLAAGRWRWLPEAAAAVVALAAAVFAARPYAQTTRGPADGYVGYLQRVAYLQADPGRLYAEDSLYWVVWYLGAPALALGTAGLALLTRRCLRALMSWRDPDRTAQAWALPLAIFGWGLVSVLWRPGTVPDQPWASRQLVPVVLPGLVVAAVWMAAWLIGRARERRAGILAVAAALTCFVVALAGPAAVTTFGIGARWAGQPGLGPRAGGVALARTGAGEAAAARQLCRVLPADASAVIVDQAAARQFTQVIRGMCGIPVGVAADASPAQVRAVIAGIERVGRRPVLLASRSAELSAYRTRPDQVVDLATRQDAHVLTQPPASTWPVRHVLWMATLSVRRGAASGA